MTKKSQAALSLLLPAIGAGLVYASYNNYISISADDPYTQDNPVLLVSLTIIGLVIMAFGIIIFFNLFKGNKKVSK